MTEAAAVLPQIGLSRRLTPAQWQTLAARCDGVQAVPARTVLTRKGAPLDKSLLLLNGFVGRYIDARRSRSSHMVAIEVAGDFVDLHGYPLKRLDHDVVTLSPVRLALFGHDGLDRLMRDDPETGRALWALTLVDAAIHRHWSFRLGALRALQRVANFIAELDLRLGTAGIGQDGVFPLPLTQRDIGQACGLTAVHVNRVLSELRQAECCTLQSGTVRIHDRMRLLQLAEFDPAFFYAGQPEADVSDADRDQRPGPDLSNMTTFPPDSVD